MAAPPTTTTTTTASSASITQRRVAKLLDTVVDEHLRELVKYVETYVPHCGGGDACTSHQDPNNNNNNNINGVAAGDDDAVVVAAAPTAMELRTALDGRSADMHRAFLREFELLHKTYHVAAGHVAKLHQQCQTLDDALQARASETESFIHTMRPLQKELMYVRQHEVQMKEFDAQLNFGAVERKRLEEDPINPAYLDVLERAREAHRRCKKLLLSRDHQQSAGVLMEATYAAISGAMERISRYLLVASADGTQQNNNSGGGVLSRGASTAGTTMSADVPEVSSFYLRCVHVLLEESPPHWERIMDEVSRRRRASVLRRYFHLLTTGSSTTSSGVYAADGRSLSASPRDGTNSNNNVDGERGRPLEAELHNPIVFFSALFAWLHQTIVEEEDLLRSFIPPGACTQEGTTATPTTTSVMVKTVAEDGEAADEAAIISARRDPNATIIALLDLIFDGITKHVRGALRGVLERFLRVSSSLAPTNEDGGDVAARGATTGAKITRGIARLLSAATGRATSVVADSTAPLAQRYAHVVTRTQQEGLALSILQGPVNGLRTCFALMQLLRFYDLTALRPLLGPTSSLSSFVAEATQVDLQQAFHQLVKVVSAHLLDSVAGVVARTTVLQQHHLSEMIWIASDLQHQQPSSSSSSSLAARGNEAHDYLLQHLFAHLPSGAVEEAADGGGGDDGSTNMSRSLSRSSFVDINAAQMLLAPQQQVVRAAEMLRVLTTFVLPVSAEVEACLEVLESLLHDTARQRATIQAYVEQQKMAGVGVGVGADEEDGINASLLTQPEQYFSPLVQALLSFTAHALPHVIATRVDVACRTIMELNVLFRLRAILAPFAESLELRAVATAVDEKIASVEVHLMDRYAVAAARFFMPSAHATSANPTPANGADVVVVVKEEEDSVAVLLQQLEQSTKELSALYALIASTGRFPTLPCLSALEEKNISTRVVQHVGQHLISVFRQQHTRLMELVKTSSAALGAAVVQERTSALMEISPEHLIRLVDAKAFRTSAS